MIESYSVKAKEIRAEYYRARYARDPVKHKNYQMQSWENKAKAIYGDDYMPPEKEGELSAQARLIRRAYYRKYRDANRERINEYSKNYQRAHTSEYRREKQKEYNRNYWERKARKNEG